MHFIIHANCPVLLKANKTQWTASWVAHYRWRYDLSIETKQPKKPNDNHWLHDDIRLPLIKRFHNNCGYCGESLPTPQAKVASKGDIDHFLPKAIYPELVYEWANYIWSCKPCNQLKKEFHSIAHPLLNPSCEEDCNQLVFIEDTGQYALQSAVANDDCWRQRFKNNEQKTMLNADEICQKRRLRISGLRQRFMSVASNLKMIHQLNSTQSTIVAILQQQTDSNIIEILEIVVSPDFYFLLQEQYQMLRQKYPQVAALLA